MNTHTLTTKILILFGILAASLSIHAGDWTVEMRNGTPQLLLDGKVVEPYIFVAARITPRRKDEIESVSAELEICQKMGVKIVQIGTPALWGEEAVDKGSIEYINFAHDLAVKLMPDVYFIPRITVSSHEGVPSFIRNDLTVRSLSADGSQEQASIASAVYRKKAVEAMQRTVRYMENRYGEHMMGYHVAAAHHGEFQYINFARIGNLLGYDVSTRDAFRRFLSKRYKTDRALKDAWKRSNASIKLAAVPPPTLRRGQSGELFHDPNREQEPIDFNRFFNENMADFVIELCHGVREVCGKRRVTAAFYGYSFECVSQTNGPSQSGHFALNRVLASPDVDMLCGPFSYHNSARVPGCAIFTHTATDSILKHGKLWLNEDDTATHISIKQRRFEDGSHRMVLDRDIVETRQILRRNFAFSIAHNQAIWWYDHHALGMWNDIELWPEYTLYKKLFHAVPQSPYTGDILLTFQEDMANYVVSAPAQRSTMEGGIASLRESVSMSGCKSSIYMIEDVLTDDIPSQLDIHGNIVALTAEQRKKLRQRAERIPTVWMWQPGLIDTSKNILSLAAVEELTGFKVRYANATDWLVWGTPDANALGWKGNSGWGGVCGHALSPIMEPGDILLGRYRSTWFEPAIVLRPGKNGKPFSVFCGTNYLPPSFVRGLARKANVHVYSNRDAGIYARDGFCAITGNEPGVYELNVGGNDTWYNVVTGKEVGVGPKLTFELELNETGVFCTKEIFDALNQ